MHQIRVKIVKVLSIFEVFEFPPHCSTTIYISESRPSDCALSHRRFPTIKISRPLGSPRKFPLQSKSPRRQPSFPSPLQFLLLQNHKERLAVVEITNREEREEEFQSPPGTRRWRRGGKRSPPPAMLLLKNTRAVSLAGFPFLGLFISSLLVASRVGEK